MMSSRTAGRLAGGLWLAAMSLVGATGTLLFSNRSLLHGLDPDTLPNLFFAPVTALWFSTVGALVVSRRPENRVGRILLAVGLIAALKGFASEYAIHALVTAPGSLPAGMFMAWLGNWARWLNFPTGFALLFLLFPDGHLPSRRWQLLAWIAVLDGTLLVLSSALDPDSLTHPVGFMFKGIIGMAAWAGGLLILVVSALSPLLRLRRATPDERQQIKWLAYVGGMTAMVFVAMELSVAAPWHSYGLPVFLACFALGIPLAAGIAILKYRLYDIDLVVNKAVVFGVLAGFITVVYVAIVVGVGALVGTAGQPNLALSILATAIVAVAFQPVRERVQGFANRLVYGKRATPYEVLAQFSERVAGAYSSNEILPRMAQVLAEGTGAARSDVWIRMGPDLVPTTSWPQGDGAQRRAIPVAGQLLPAVPGVDRAVAVKHQGELLGALTINKRAGEALTPVEEKLLADLAAQAGLVLRNVRLTAELQARLEEISKQAKELRASRQRIVAAQDAERRRLERNIHDGAQQNLVALSVKLRLARNFATRNPQRAKEILRELEAETGQALDTLRDLARGIYPPLLRERGLAAALQAHAASMEIPVEINAEGIGRYASDIEAAVYFCCLEALQNAAKHASASRVQLQLHEQDGQLAFSVVDDGCGFDPDKASQGTGLRNMTDRIEAVGGRLEVRAGSSGTSVVGRVPTRLREPVPVAAAEFWEGRGA